MFAPLATFGKATPRYGIFGWRECGSKIAIQIVVTTIFVVGALALAQGSTETLVVADRPVTVMLPDRLAADEPVPVIVALHGYGGSGRDLVRSYGLAEAASVAGVVLIIPEGRRDPRGYPFWDAGRACCNFFDAEGDDAAFLASLPSAVSEAMSDVFTVDPARTYLFGLSNGSFMAFRVACEYPGQFAALVSIAGAVDAGRDACPNPEPMGVLHIHGTRDETILFGGGDLFGVPYTTAFDTMAIWTKTAGCLPDEQQSLLDVDTEVRGLETIARAWPCGGDLRVTLWEVRGGAHEPTIGADFGPSVLSFLLHHRQSR